MTITEAIFGQHSLKDQALASGGAAMTKTQADKLKIIGPRKGIILSPDNDNAGISSILANFRLLEPLGYPMFYSIPPKIKYTKGPGQKVTKDWNELIEELKCTREEVRAIHDKGIHRLSLSSMSRLYGLLHS